MNIVCVICSDLLTPSDDSFYTPCGHIFHFACLTQWLERSRTCPQCREKVTQSKIHRIYFNFSNNDTIIEDATSLQSTVDGLKFQLLIKERELKQAVSNSSTYKTQTAGLRAEVLKLENELTHKNTAILALKEQAKFFKEQSLEGENCKKEVARLKKKLDELKSVQVLVNAPSEDVDEMISLTQDPATLVTYISVLKTELTNSVGRRKELRTSLTKLQQHFAKVEMERNFLSEEHEKRKHLEEMLAVAESEKYALQKRLREFENGSPRPKNIAGQKKNVEGSINKRSKNDRTIDVEENAVSLDKTSDIIDLSEDSPVVKKKRTIIKNGDVVALSPTDEPVRGNDENSLRGCKHNTSVRYEHIMKRKSRLVSGNSSYSILAKKPRLAQTNLTARSSSDLTYDGFGGHAKNDKFPSPKKVNELRKSNRPANKKNKLDDGNNKKLGNFLSSVVLD